MTLKELSAQVTSAFQKKYGRPPCWIVAALGRVNVIGEHTDYNNGFVLPMAIDRYAVMAADAADSSVISIYDSQAKASAQIDISGKVTKGEPKWSNYIRGVIAGFQDRGLKAPGLDVVLESNVPLGGGLSSSAALEVCTATVLETAIGKAIDPFGKALLSQNVEHEFAGVPCGIMDQLRRLPSRAFNLQDPLQMERFIENQSREIAVQCTGKTLIFHHLQSVWVGISELDTSQAIAVGAYVFALNNLI